MKPKPKATPKPTPIGKKAGKPESRANEPSFRIVGVGASAGGLEAFTALLKALPKDTGMAFVLVQHMDPAHESALSKILSRSTEMPVNDITDGVAVKPNRVYVIPSNGDITIRGGVLRLHTRKDFAKRHLPIDLFFESLAEDRKHASIGIILSGTASDGTQGLKAIKAEGGVTFAQDEQSARHTGMPISAVEAGCVDFVLPPEKIASELVRLGKQPADGIPIKVEDAELSAEGATSFSKICHLLKTATGVDFPQYKPPTIIRRLARRMGLKRVDNIDKYLEQLRKDPAEVEALYKDILVHVTGFFRDPEAFKALQSRVLANIVAHKKAGNPIRVWVPGCSTGEEVYSIAMALLEALGEQPAQRRIQLFGTDISESSIHKARSGTYNEASLANVNPERLKRFFVKVEVGHQISKQVREYCVFARHDLTKDPPFSNLDLISCRNLLIYLGAGLQKRTMEIFHYAINDKGYLFLGQSESLSEQSGLFTLEDRKHKIYSRRLVTTPHFKMLTGRAAAMQNKGGGDEPPAGGAFDLKKEAERVLLARFAPAAIVVDPELQIVHFQGDTSPYIAPATGEPSFHLLRMLRSDLVVEVRAAMQRVKNEGVSIGIGPLRIKHAGREKLVRVEVAPLEGHHAKGHDFMVLFHDEHAQHGPASEAAQLPAETIGEAKRVADRLNQELTSTRDYLRSLVEDHEATYEELKAANEEVQSGNEELQSTNEELETTKEELQSSNEELTTLNEEQQNRNVELVQLANDLSNLLVGVNIPIVILDDNLRIRRFTPMAEKILNLIPGDAGRPFAHIASNLIVADWNELFSEVRENLQTVEREVQDQQGVWHLLRMRPYKTAENQIDGVLMALFNIDQVKCSLEQAREARDYAEAVVETIRDPLLVLDAKLSVLSANTSFYQKFRTTAQETVGRMIYQLGDGQWNIPALRQLLDKLLPQDSRIENFEVDHEFPEIGHRNMLLNARQIYHVGLGMGMILLAIGDITEQLAAKKELEATKERFRAVVEGQSEFICRFLPDGTLTFVNEAFCRYFNVKQDEIVGQNFIDKLVLKGDRVPIREHLSAFSPGKPVGTFDGQINAPDERWRQWTSRAFFDDRGRIVEFQSVGRDITEQKNSQAVILKNQAELRSMTSKLISAEEDNKKRLARELHDDFSQRLAVLAMEVSAIDSTIPKSSKAIDGQLRKIGMQIGELAKDIHQIARQLHPAILDDLGLSAALKNECLVYSQKNGIPVKFRSERVQKDLPVDIALCLYRVTQECLRNIGHHAKAKEVHVTLNGGRDISLKIQDIGDGFDLKKVKTKGGLGLISMDERVRLVGGTFSIQSEIGKGTIVEVRIPLPRKEA